jgi:peptidyl-prolyl cis-trans isomerase D
MIAALRSDKVMKSLLWGVLILTIPSFVLLYGWGELSNAQLREESRYGTIVTKVGGSSQEMDINPQQMDWAKAQLRREMLFRLYSLLGNNIGQQFAKWDRLFTSGYSNDFVLHRVGMLNAIGQLANQLNLVIPESELNARIAEQVAGASQAQLRQALARQGLRISDFKENIAYEMLIGQATLMLEAQAKASLYELYQEYLLAEEEIVASSVNIAIGNYVAEFNPTSEEIQAYFDDNKEEFRVPNRMKLAYISLNPNERTQSIMEAITDEEVEEHYEKVKDAQYKTPRELEVRHLAIHFSQEGTPRDLAEAVEIANSVKRALQLGVDFQTLADRFSDDPTNFDNDTFLGNGGELGQAISERSTQFGDQYRSAVTGLEKAGDVTDMVISDYRAGRAKQEAIFFVQAYEIIDASYTPLEQIQQNIKRQLALEKAREEVRDKIPTWRAEAEIAISLDDLAKIVEADVKETGWIDREKKLGYVHPIGDLSRYEILLEDVYEGGDISPLIEINTNTHVVFEVSEYERAHVPTSMDEMETTTTVRSALVRSLATSKAQDKAAELVSALLDADDPTSFADVAQSLELPAQQQSFKRLSMPYPFTSIEDFDRRSLGAPQGIPFIEQVTNSFGDVNSVVVWQLDSRVEPPMDEFRENRIQLEREYFANKAAAMIEEYIADLLSKGQLEINPGPALQR